MAFTVIATSNVQGEWELVDAGLYKAKVSELEEGPETYGPSVKVWFEIESDISGDDYFAGQRVNGVAGLKINVAQDMESKLYRWYRAITGQTAQEGQQVDLNDMLGQSAIIKVEQSTSKNGRTYANVVDVTPMPARRSNGNGSRKPNEGNELSERRASRQSAEEREPRRPRSVEAVEPPWDDKDIPF